MIILFICSQITVRLQCIFLMWSVNGLRDSGENIHINICAIWKNKEWKVPFIFDFLECSFRHNYILLSFQTAWESQNNILTFRQQTSSHPRCQKHCRNWGRKRAWPTAAGRKTRIRLLPLDELDRLNLKKQLLYEATLYKFIPRG